jgi:hypothetical protein
MEFGEPAFEIAVYRKSPGELDKEYEARLKREVLRLEPRLASNDIDYKQTEAFRFVRSRSWEENGTPYPYNQIVGWVVIVVKHDQILAEYYKVADSKLTRHSGRHPVRWQGKTFAIYLTGKETNKRIVRRLLEELRLLSEESPFKGRYVDTRAFERLSPYVDWRRMMRESCPC